MFSNLSFSGLAIFPVLGFLIFIHELGHFMAARWMGVKVFEFGFGYPPRMLTLFVKDGVEYTLNWLPFGGFVKLAGENDDFDAEGSLTTVAPWRRIVVMAAGPFMNVVTAIVIFSALYMIGVPTFVGDEKNMPVQIVSVEPSSPAAVAGLEGGDQIVSIGGTSILGIDNVSSAIKASAGQPTKMTIKRGDETITTSITPRLPEEIPAGRGSAGVQIALAITEADTQIVKHGFFESIMLGAQQSWDVTVMMIDGLGSLLRALFSPKVAMPEGGVGGIVAIGRVTAEVAREGIQDLLSLMAFLSLNLALLNMLPIPALDGGRIVFALAELIGRKRIPPEKEALVHFAGFAILVTLMIVVTFVDVSNWIAGKPALPGG